MRRRTAMSRIVMFIWMLTVTLLISSVYGFNLLEDHPPRLQVGESIAVITAIFGTFERTLKSVREQSVPCEFICFTDQELQPRKPWQVDSRPYHLEPELRAGFDQGQWVNSFENDRHPHNLAKFYKQQFFRIPRMKSFSTVIWLDSSFEVNSTNFVWNLLGHLRSCGGVVALYEHPWNWDYVQEAYWSMLQPRWSGTMLRGIKQPFQNLTRQVLHYKHLGFSRYFFRPFEQRGYGHYGLWTCGISIWNMLHPTTRAFLDTWYLQNLNFTTQDQVSFPFTAWSHSVFPCSMPKDVYRNGLVKYRGHGK